MRSANSVRSDDGSVQVSRLNEGSPRYFPYSRSRSGFCTRIQQADQVTKSSVTVMLKDLFERLAERHQVSKKQAQDASAGMVETVTKRLKQDERIRINGLGTLEVRKCAARTGRNQVTGEKA
jgi:nucleoid DNA-binding protein